MVIKCLWAGRQEGSEVGAKTICLYESTNGSDFTKVATYNSSSYPGMLDSGWSYGDTPVEYTGVAGRYYYAVVKCYAGDSTGGDSRWYETPYRRQMPSLAYALDGIFLWLDASV